MLNCLLLLSALELAPRVQWSEEGGYCGETSLVVAGLYYGQYCSQKTARRLAGGELLVGVNAKRAARAMRLKCVEWEGKPKPFQSWIKGHVREGHPVVIGVFLKGADDEEYDHLVVVTDDAMSFNDHGLRGSCPLAPRSRREANARNAPPYSLNKDWNYGIAITGIEDRDGETIPVRVVPNCEVEDGRPVVLTATVSIPDPRVAYRLYVYDDFSSVPTSGFSGNRAIRYWDIPAGVGPTYVVQWRIRSDETAVFRAVPVGVPYY